MRLQHCPPSLPSPLLILLNPRLILSLAYNSYAAVGPSNYASDTALTPPYTSSHPPNMPPTLLTILTLAVPSRHASNTLTSQHASEATYNPYACTDIPTFLDAAYHPYARSDLPICRRRCLQSLLLYNAFPVMLV
ncbi:hypothetical protein O181_072022 [Austropuccinia psidii MF-1]|uniref:Uncharacterized protein n=1 Tax=Austropuccinia psidii MF-1 TaxID=1389203 RepID=A0A9Q3F8R4_9BASI|nr:hypothetical protein [Austropuccinia psidii MF-1]